MERFSIGRSLGEKDLLTKKIEILVEKTVGILVEKTAEVLVEKTEEILIEKTKAQVKTTEIPV